MKRKILLCALITACLSIAAYSTTAYFSREETATNVIVAGNIKIELHEQALTDDGELVPFKEPLDILPGTEASKIVQIENIGRQPAWIRISVDKSIQLVEDQTDADLSLVSYDLNSEYWTESDGYYYYNSVLNPGQTTEPLFTKVIFDPSMDNRYQQSKAVLKITAQATQVSNNGKTVFEAAGWPEAE